MKVGTIFNFNGIFIEYRGNKDYCDIFKCLVLPKHTNSYAKALYKWWYDSTKVDYNWDNNILILREYVPEYQDGEIKVK